MYSEPIEVGASFRIKQQDELKRLVLERRVEANERRHRFFQPDLSSAEAYADSIVHLREEYRAMLGWPMLEDSRGIPAAKVIEVATDEQSEIYRLEIEAMPGVTVYGLLFLPVGKTQYPLVIVQHGGGGTPELCSSFFDSTNYNDITRRITRYGVAAFAPQLYLWSDAFGPAIDRKQMDVELKQVGSSITALEIFKIQRSLDFLLARYPIEDGRVGMTGLSYGGFYTLYTTAAEPRIKAAFSSCCFNDRYTYDWSDWVWFDSAGRFLDTEVCGLIAPRPLAIEVGIFDELFDVSLANKEIQKVSAIYDALGIGDRLFYREFEGGHEYGKDDAGIEFLLRWLC